MIVTTVTRNARTDDGILFINVVNGPDEHQEQWGALAMGLMRRSAEQQADEPLRSPFSLGVVFLAQGRYVEPDFPDVRVDRFSRRDNLFGVSLTLPEVFPADALAVMIERLHQAVDEACVYARKKRIADDLPGLRRAVNRLAEAGPAPVRRPQAPERPVWADDSGSPCLRLTVSSGHVEIDPSEDLLVSHLDLLDDGLFFELKRLGFGESLRVSRVGRFVQIDRREFPEGPLHVARLRDTDRAARVLVAWAFQHESGPADFVWQVVEA